jgi:hypothetical protein
MFLVSFALMSPTGLAHENNSIRPTPQQGWQLEATLHTVYRNKAIVTSDQRWLMPGRLLGGESLPFPKGLHLDEAFVTLSYGGPDSYGLIKMGQHGSNHGAALEHAYVGTQIGPDAVLELGKMSAVFSPHNPQHSSQTRYAAPLLLYDAFFGRQYIDDGIRLRGWLLGDRLELGIEGWQGSHFPTKNSHQTDPTFDLYAVVRQQDEPYQFILGTFYWQAQADSRSDDRYDTSHSHGVDTSSLTPLYFSGDVRIVGWHGYLSFAIAEDSQIGLQGEWAVYESDGDLSDNTRVADYKANHKAMWAEVFARKGAHQLATRYERIQLKNELWGSAAGSIVDLANLNSQGKDPYRLAASYNLQWQPDSKLRLEWAREYTTGSRQDIASASVVWQVNVKSIP